MLRTARMTDTRGIKNIDQKYRQPGNSGCLYEICIFSRSYEDVRMWYGHRLMREGKEKALMDGLTGSVSRIGRKGGLKVHACTAMFFALSLAFALSGCGEEQGFCKTEEGFYSYDGRLYKNDGEFFPSEKELEYIELMERFPDGIAGAEWYTEMYRYSDWLLLGADESRYLPGLEGYRYFLLIPEEDGGRSDCQLPAGTPSSICYNGTLYRYEKTEASKDMPDSMKEAGFIRSLGEGWPVAELQANSGMLLGHLLFEYDGKLLIAADGNQYAVYIVSEYQP